MPAARDTCRRLRTAIQHPDVVDRLVLVSTVFKRSGWYPEMEQAMIAMGPEVAEPLRQTRCTRPTGASRRGSRTGRCW